MRKIAVLALAATITAPSGLYLVQERNAMAQPKDQTLIEDSRSAIYLSESESAFIRREMRGLLESIRDILEASQGGNHTHRGFDQIAMDAEKMGAADLTLKQLTHLMGNCTACHATWRLADEGKR